jgi:hypothetical protein
VPIPVELDELPQPAKAKVINPSNAKLLKLATPLRK